MSTENTSEALEVVPMLIRFLKPEREALDNAAAQLGTDVTTLVRKLCAHSCGIGALHDQLEAERLAGRRQHTQNMVNKRWQGHEKKPRVRTKKVSAG